MDTRGAPRARVRAGGEGLVDLRGAVQGAQCAALVPQSTWFLWRFTVHGLLYVYDEWLVILIKII